MAITPAVRILLHELATPLTVLMSASDILRNRAPSPVEQLIDRVRDISHQFGREVIELRTNLNERIDLQSSSKAAEQIRRQAADWGQYEARLAPLVAQIQAAAITLPEPLLDRLLNQSLSDGLGELGRVLSRLTTIQAGDLETP